MSTKQAPAPAAHVMLRANWPGEFKRSIFKTVGEGKTAKRERVRVLTFSPGTAVALDAEELEAVKDDLGTALVEVEFDGKSRPRVVHDQATGEATDPGERLAALEQENAELVEAVEQLVAQVKELGAEPVVEFAAEDSGDRGRGTGNKKSKPTPKKGKPKPPPATA